MPGKLRLTRKGLTVGLIRWRSVSTIRGKIDYIKNSVFSSQPTLTNLNILHAQPTPLRSFLRKKRKV